MNRVHLEGDIDDAQQMSNLVHHKFSCHFLWTLSVLRFVSVIRHLNPHHALFQGIQKRFKAYNLIGSLPIVLCIASFPFYGLVVVIWEELSCFQLECNCWLLKAHHLLIPRNDRPNHAFKADFEKWKCQWLLVWNRGG